MFKFRSNSGQKCSPEPEQKCCSGTGTGTGIPVDLCYKVLSFLCHKDSNYIGRIAFT